MSYILDALRRAQAERERGQVPGLHAQTGVHRELPARRAAPPALIWLMLCAALALAVAALMSLWWLRQPAAQTVAAVPPVTPAAAPALTALAPTVPMQAPAAARAASWPVVVSVSAPPLRAPVPATAAAIALSALTPEQRRDWPALALGGSVWSDNAASRFVIFNGSVWREGDEVLPGVVLARIGPKAAQLRWRNTLVEVPL